MNYLLSIITPSLNRAQFISEAVGSVQQQDHPHVEHIIMDGGSTDGTLDLLGNFPSLRVYSQPDQGIYDALNKGIDLAHGEVIGFLNTDDLYEPYILGAIAKIFIDNPQIDALVGGASIFRSTSSGDQSNLAMFPCVPMNQLLERSTLGAPVFNAWFFRKRLLKQLNGFDTRYRYAADRDLLIRMAFEKTAYWSLNKPVYRYRMHAGSVTLSGEDSGEADHMFESRSIAERYLQRRDISGKESKCFKNWHSQIILEQIRSAWRKRAFGRMAAYALAGVRYNINWPLIFALKVVERLPYIVGIYSDSGSRSSA